MGKKPKIIRDKLKDKIINVIWTLFETEEEKEERKRKKHNERIIKEQEEDYYEPKRVSNFWNNNYNKYESNGDKKRDLSLE